MPDQEPIFRPDVLILRSAGYEELSSADVTAVTGRFGATAVVMPAELVATSDSEWSNDALHPDLAALLNRLRDIREAWGRSQADVAREMGVRQSTLSDAETVKGEPRLTTIMRYVQALGLQLSMLISTPLPEQEVQGDSSPTELRLVGKVDEMTPERWAAVRAVLGAFGLGLESVVNPIIENED